jgi:putative membrane protein
MKIKAFALCATVCTALAAHAKADKLTDAELHVLAHVHHVDQMEIDAGKVAQKKGSTQAVKSYGKMLVTDHTQNDKDVLAMAKKHGQKLPADELKMDKDAMDRLTNMKGADYDREFLRQMAEGHDKELANIDGEVDQSSNNEVIELLKGMKPVLQKHADQARDLMKGNAQASLDLEKP